MTGGPAMSTWLRWKIAVPLIGLSLLMLVPAVAGTVLWWSEDGIAYRTLSLFICFVAVTQTGVAISIGARPTEDVPWIKIGMVIICIAVTCGLAFLRSEL